jgi:hypothetical protein
VFSQAQIVANIRCFRKWGSRLGRLPPLRAMNRRRRAMAHVVDHLSVEELEERYLCAAVD